MKRLTLICLLLLVSMASAAQDATSTPESEDVEFAFEFPVDTPTQEQVDDAYACALIGGTEEESDATATPEAETSAEMSEACQIANEALALAAARGEDEDVSDEEIALFHALVEANPALALRIDMISRYFNVSALVAAPEFVDQPITALHFTYTFSGLGPSNDYDVTVTDADSEPQVTGTVEISTGSEDEEDPLTLPETVNRDVVQAFGPALSDLLPIGTQFSAAPCWDYYPDWTVEITFADGMTLNVVTNQSNVIGIGGPWQVEIDGQHYMQYSGGMITAVADLFEALELPLGETAAMGCGGVSDPLWDAYPRELEEAEE